jgi:hypothetical protein
MPLKKIAIGAGLVVAVVVVVPVVLASVTFDTLFPQDGELAEKSEWAVLQGLEDQHRETPHRAPALVVRNALDSKYTGVGFPARDRDRGYIWVLANPTTKPCVKQLPFDRDFSVSADTLAWVKSQTTLDPHVTKYLEAPIRHVLSAGFEKVPSWDLEGCRA